MPEPPEVEVTEEDLRKLDSEYEPFRGVDAWPDAVSRPDLWDHSVASIERTRAEAAPDELERALEFVVRAAALDTGAIENLYSVDRGFTITVAAQATAWQAQLEERGAIGCG